MGLFRGIYNQEALDQKLLWFSCFCAQYEDLVVFFLLMEKEKFVTQLANI